MNVDSFISDNIFPPFYSDSNSSGFYSENTDDVMYDVPKDTHDVVFMEDDEIPLLFREFPTLRELLKLSPAEWEQRLFKDFNQLVDYYCAVCVTASGLQADISFMEKHDLPAGSEIAVIGDIHGNGLRLDLTFKSLQQQGFLDEHYQCKLGKYVVFLGDYVDRGSNNLKVLEMVMAFKLENPLHVFLLRGNHEDVKTVQSHQAFYTQHDPKYVRYLSDSDNVGKLQQLYQKLPVAVYLGERNQTSQPSEYMQFCHGLFHLYTDPQKLLAAPELHASLVVKEENTWSERIELIKKSWFFGNDENTIKTMKQYLAICKLEELAKEIKPKLQDIYWLDVDKQQDLNKAERKKISPEYAKAYLRVSSSNNFKVKQIIRGHQQGGIWSAGENNKKNFIFTVDPSAFPHRHMFMKIKLSSKIKDCKKSIVCMPMNANAEHVLRHTVEFTTN